MLFPPLLNFREALRLEFLGDERLVDTAHVHRRLSVKQAHIGFLRIRAGEHANIKVEEFEEIVSLIQEEG